MPLNSLSYFPRGSACSRPNTLLHIPSSCRLRMIAATAQCWRNMARSSDDFALLEEGRSKLLLASVPTRAWHRARSGQAPHSLGRNAVLRTSSGVPRNNSSSIARLARGRSVPKSFSPPPLWKDRPTATRRWNLLRPSGKTGTALCWPAQRRSHSSRPHWHSSGTRHGHSQRANKLHAALSALFCRISAGTLPPAARWLTRTRLCLAPARAFATGAAP